MLNSTLGQCAQIHLIASDVIYSKENESAKALKQNNMNI
ncbi:hypothetical protein AB07_4201 [Citrobacter freundii]|uniref:Uncharacterized protein n=1 Tax=Citrobacter freundii TaxID=546 RepID=A0A7G2IP38_CITFR|nr:hypothetical protein AB07_4201 [Citrobacter freundii]CDL38121.1 hypothetical protein [Citrobacter freundii]